MVSIDKFIENFKKGFPEEQMKNIFTQGNCFHFATMLESFYSGYIVYDPHNQHFLFKRGKRFYDINGEVDEPLDFQLWEDLEEDGGEEYEFLLRNCVFKI